MELRRMPVTGWTGVRELCASKDELRVPLQRTEPVLQVQLVSAVGLELSLSLWREAGKDHGGALRDKWCHPGGAQLGNPKGGWDLLCTLGESLGWGHQRGPVFP